MQQRQKLSNLAYRRWVHQLMRSQTNLAVNWSRKSHAANTAHAFGKQASQPKLAKLGAGISALRKPKQISVTQSGIN
jgi:hypothetical protein